VLILPETTPIHQTSVWSLLYFSHSVYVFFSFSALLYVLPNLALFTGASGFISSSKFSSIDGNDLVRLLATPMLLLMLLHFSWSGPTLTAWFGHLVFSTFQFKVTYLLSAFFTSYICLFLTGVHYSSVNVYDYTTTLFNFFLWLWLMFFSNNLFTFIFFLELLSALVTLLLVTSTFSSAHFYNTLSYSKHSYFQTSTPTALLQVLLMFFWTTLLSSLTLFVFLIMFYLQFLTFDWNLIDSVFAFLVSTASLQSIFTVSFSWLLILVCVFIKCGVVPFFLWKPVFFKGMTLISLFFYIYVYYFSVFIFFLYVIFFYLNELFFFNLYVVVLLIIVGTLGVSVLLFESFYLKSFLALSSILNSILIFYALCGFQATDLLFLI
jgi:hypothetical protein